MFYTKNPPQMRLTSLRDIELEFFVHKRTTVFDRKTIGVFANIYKSASGNHNEMDLLIYGGVISPPIYDELKTCSSILLNIKRRNP